jgi:hypothetical protein
MMQVIGRNGLNDAASAREERFEICCKYLWPPLKIAWHGSRPRAIGDGCPAGMQNVRRRQRHGTRAGSAQR